MKKIITKVIGMLMAIMVLLSGIYGVFTFAADPAPAEPKTATYYVRYGGTGDGLSPVAPVATVDDAIKAANAAGLGVGDTVYVNVMQSADWNWGANTIGAGGDYRADAHHITTWAARGAVSEHSYKMVVQGYGEDDVYLASNGQLGFNLDMILGGDTEFKNIVIVRMRRWRSLLANGFNVKYGSDVEIGCVNVDDCDSSFKKWNGTIDKLDGTTAIAFGNVNKLPSGGGGAIELNNGPIEVAINVSSTTDIWGSGGVTGPSNEVEKYSNDVTVVYNNSGIISDIRWGNQHGGGTTFEKNLNIDIRSARKVGYLKGNGSVEIKGGLQVISSNGISGIEAIPDNVTAQGMWFITNKGGADLVGLTETAGTYTVKEGETAYAVDLNDNSKSYTSEDGKLVLPEGRYLVTKMSSGGNEASYYVQYGGTGDGLSPEAPVATVDDAIKAANAAGLGVGDTVYVNVMQSADWNWGANTIGAGGDYRADAHHITTWAARGAVSEHNYKMVVQGYGEDDVYLASNGQLGFNLDMILGGDTEFKNIVIVRMRRWRSLLTNGFNVKYGSDVEIGCVNVDDCDSSFKKWNGTIDKLDGTTAIALGNVNKLPSGGGGAIELNNGPIGVAINVSSTTDIWGSGGVTGPSNEVEKYSNDVKVIYNNSGIKSTVRWGNQYGGGTIFEGDLVFDIKSANIIGYEKGKGTVTVNGDLQILTTVGINDIANIPANVTVNGGKWFVTVRGDSDMLALTETSGTYAVKEGLAVVATDLADPSKTYTSAEGILVLPAGNYEVAKQKNENAEATYYVQYGGKGDGLSAETPLSTVDDAVKAANAAGFTAGDTVYVNVMQSADWNWGANEIGAGGNYRSDPHHMTTWAARGDITTHRFDMVVQGYGEGDVYLAGNGALGLNLDIVMGGPTTFKNITIVRMRRWRGIFANGCRVMFGEGTNIGIINVDDCSASFEAWDGKVTFDDGVASYSLGNVNKLPFGGGNEIIFKNAPSASTIVLSTISDIWVSGVPTGPKSDVEKYSNDVSVIFDNKKFTANISWGNEYGGSTLFEKNLSINAKAVNRLNYVEGKGSVTINGDLQIIAKAGANIAELPENVTVKGKKWFISNAGGYGLLDLTETVGTYKIMDGVTAIATDLSDPTKVYTSSDGVLTLPAGSYVVTRYTTGGNEATYFVKYGGTGDGLTPDTPLATVNDAVNAAIDEGLGKGDTIYINVIQSDDWDYGANVLGAGGNYYSDAHHITTWSENGDMTAHTATIVVQGYGEGEIYLATNDRLGRNLDMILGGPTVFKDIVIVRMRNWRGLLTNGYDVTYGSGTKIARINVDDCQPTFKAWDGKFGTADTTTMFALGNKTQTAQGGGATITFSTELPESTLYISGINDLSGDIERYKNDVTIVYDYSKFYQKISWGQLEGGESVFEKNLNVNIKAASKLLYLTGGGKVFINGGLQIIANCGEIEEFDISSVSNNVIAKKGKWFITNNGNAEILLTETAGTFTISDKSIVTAVNVKTKQRYTSKGGVLTIPQGEYVIEEVDDGVWWNEADIDEGKDLSKVSLKGSFKDNDDAPISGIKLELISDKNVYSTVTNEKGEFWFKDIKAGFYELYTVDAEGNRFSTGYFSTFNDGDDATVTLVLNSETQRVINGVVKGNVYTPDLKPVAGLEVHLGEFGSVKTDKNGYFEFVEVPAGNYDVFAFMKDGSRQVMRTLEVKESTELSMKLKYESGDPTDADEDSFNMLIVIMVAAALVVVAAIVILFVIIKKRRKA